VSGPSADKGLPDPADQRLFIVDAEAFDAFMDRLDRPAEAKPQLAELLRRRPTFDGCGCPAGINPAHDCDLVQDAISTHILPPGGTDA
jgi:hypothetical protein